MRFQVVTQISLVIIAIIMVIFVIKPKLADIGTKQTEAREFEQTVARATQYNNKLAQLLDKAKSFSRTDLIALETYVPERIDVLQVSQDIESIIKNSGLLLENIEVASGDELVTSVVDTTFEANAIADPALDPSLSDVTDPDNVSPFMPGVSLLDEANRNLVYRQFTFTALGTYDQFKQLLIGLEGNNYPLLIVEMSFEVGTDSDLTEYEFTVETYAMPSGQQANQNNSL